MHYSHWLQLWESNKDSQIVDDLVTLSKLSRLLTSGLKISGHDLRNSKIAKPFPLMEIMRSSFPNAQEEEERNVYI